MKLNLIVPFIVTSIIVVAEVAISFNSALMPTIKDTFSISEQLAQMTLGVGLFALGCAGLIYGGLADTLGRRPIFLFSMSFFSITALICAISQSIEVFLLARFMQGIGSGAGWVVGNACLRDVFQGQSYTKVMNYVHAVAGITPAVAPVVGSYLGVAIGWRWTFALLFIFALAAVLLIYMIQPETLKEKKTFCMKDFLKGYRLLFSNHQYIRYLILKILMVMLLFCEASNVPLIYVDHMGVRPEHYGFYVCPLLVFYILSTALSGKLSQRWHVDRLLQVGLILHILSNTTIVCLNSMTALTPMLIQSIKATTYMGWGLIFGNATAQIVDAVPERAGAASAMMIALEMLCSSLGIFCLSFFFNGTIVPLSVFMAGTGLFCLFFMRHYQQKEKAFND